METLIVERKDGVVTVTMNRPERKNAANAVMLNELRTIFEEVERDPSDRVMVLTGAGGAFCSGADLGDPNGPASDSSQHGLTRMRRLGDVALALHRITKPTIAKVDGFAVGAGLSLALGCDLIVCTEAAKLSMIFSRRGLSLDNGASWLMPRLSRHGQGQGDRTFRRHVERPGGPRGRSGEPGVAGRRDRCLRGRLGHHPGRRPTIGVVDDQNAPSCFLAGQHGGGGGGRSPLPGIEFLDQGHGRSHGGLRPEAGSRLYRALNRVVLVLNGVQGMVGDTALVTRAIEGAHHPGRIRARGEEWFAIALDPDTAIGVGTTVVVADVQRGLLVVYAAE